MRCNAPAAEVKSYGSGQTGADRKAPIEAQNERELHTGIQTSCADIVALGYLTPITHQDLDPTPRLNEDIDKSHTEPRDMQDQTQNTQQHKDGIESDKEDAALLQAGC